MNRRSFMTLASGLLVPWEPERVYSFLPAWRLVSRWVLDNGHIDPSLPLRLDASLSGDAFTSAFYHMREAAHRIHPSNVLDVLKSCDAFGYPRPVIL